MSLIKLAKVGSIVVAGVIIGSVTPYVSHKAEIVKGIETIQDAGVQAQGQKDTLDKQVNELKTQVENLTNNRNELNNDIQKLDVTNKQLKLDKNALTEQLGNVNKEIEAVKESATQDFEKLRQEANKQIDAANADQKDIIDALGNAETALGMKK